ncbi:hypothetical protein MZM54_03505 [[Brevibacterium] frigoritolerans]|nr:hypothetical protein [Peribacillus frigoritolerans]
MIGNVIFLLSYIGFAYCMFAPGSRYLKPILLSSSTVASLILTTRILGNIMDASLFNPSVLVLWLLPIILYIIILVALLHSNLGELVGITGVSSLILFLLENILGPQGSFYLYQFNAFIVLGGIYFNLYVLRYGKNYFAIKK